MGEINHFSHENHPLKLIGNWDTVLSFGGDNEETKGVVVCKVCRDTISLSSGCAYGCIECDYFLHETCAELPSTINHHIHPAHPLRLIVLGNAAQWNCDVCGKEGLVSRFSYQCSECNFDACTKCAATVVSKEETLIKLKHKGHPQHMLTLQSRPASFLCDACHSEQKDFFYQCDSCDFWIHKTCASLDPTINLPHHHHSLVLVHLLPDNFYNYEYFCEFCGRFIVRNVWLYHCANCRVFAHIECALNAPPPRDDQGTSAAEEYKDLLHFPMPYSFTDPLKLLFGKLILDDDDESNKNNHWSHPEHSLILNVEEPQGNNMPDIDSSDLIEVCYVCVRPLSFPYYTCCEDGCSFALHKYCAQLPQTLKHQPHPDHSLNLVDTSGYMCFYNFFPVKGLKCTGCHSHGNTFMYKCDQTDCQMSLCVNCAFLPNTIKHKSHYHPLVQLIDPKAWCNACRKWYSGISYSCKDCDFQLCMFCVMRSPQSLTHRYCKGHEIPLTYPPVENHPEDYYCDICEKEMHPKYPLYHCEKCTNSFHLGCLSPIDYFANTFYKGTDIVSYHKHPLTFVRRQKGTPQYVCSTCNRDINGLLILECRAKLCNFKICYECGVSKS